MTRNDYKRARVEKDRNFDGVFFFGVKTTGIFCRPSCPSPVAKEKNVLYFHTLIEALQSGLRPCRRCKPDLQVEFYNGNIRGTEVVHQALTMISEGYLNYHSLAELAAELDVSDRHLRKLFVENVGTPPVQVAKYQKAHFARKLLEDSDQSITGIACAAGFGSLRQFNAVFKDVFEITPSAMRKEMAKSKHIDPGTTLLLRYTPPFDFGQMLSFLQLRQINGVELVGENSYARTFRIHGSTGYFSVTDAPELNALRLKIHSDDVKCYMAVSNKVRKLFDLDTDFTAINALFSKDKILSQGMVNGHTPRLPAAFEPFEFTVRAILGQQITVKAATTLAGRIVERSGLKTNSTYPDGLDYYFPTVDEFIKMDLSDLGITTTRQTTLMTMAQAVQSGEIVLSSQQPFEEFEQKIVSLKGIGEWTAHYVGMRGLGMIDSFPASDLGIIKALTENGQKPSVATIKKIAEKWRPYRAYAALCLWNYATKKEQE